MNRLTEFHNGVWGMSTQAIKNGYDRYSVFSKLAAYEDTGLEPEEIEKGKKYFTLANRKYSTVGKVIEYAANMKDLEEQGLLIKLPCKLGTKLFIIQTELWADGKSTRREKRIIESEFTDWNILHVVDNWGKTVFLTREEAEKALKEMEGK